jgi:L-ribulose-5-phosphate 4-epimerase
MQNHGIFTIGKNARAALKSAVYVEDAARTMFYAMQLGEIVPIPPDLVAKLHKRYTEDYGQ